jgi:hypothetical protein
VSDVAGNGTRSSQRLRRLAETVAIFAAVGPPLGGLVYVETAILPGTWDSERLPSILFAMIDVPLFALPFSYFFGIIPACITGLIIGIRQIFFGPVGWPEVLAWGLIIGALFALVVRPSDWGPLIIAAEIMTNAVPTLLCWRIVRSRMPTRAPTGSPALGLKELAK